MERIDSRKNPIARHLKRLGADSAYRRESGEFLCDGVKLLEDAVLSGAAVSTVLTSSGIPFPLPLDTHVLYTDRSLLNSLSALKNSQDTLFACKFPAHPIDAPITATAILLDGMQDPGNVGAIIRSADAFGISCVIMTGECADPYNPKAVRASMGAIFRQRVIKMGLAELIGLKNIGKRFIGTASSGDCRYVGSIELGGTIIAIGSEGSGLSNAVLELCEQSVMIPTTGQCESLNAAVAAAIVMWEAMRAHRVNGMGNDVTT